MRPWLFFLFLAIASDMLAAFIGARAAWRHRNGAGGYIAILLFGIFLRGFGELVANGFGFQVKPVYSVGFAWAYWSTRLVYCLGVWRFVLWLVSNRPKAQAQS